MLVVQTLGEGINGRLRIWYVVFTSPPPSHHTPPLFPHRTHLHSLLKIAEVKNSYVQGQYCMCLSQCSGETLIISTLIVFVEHANSKMKAQRHLGGLYFSIMMSAPGIMWDWLEKLPKVTLINMWWFLAFQCCWVRGVASSLQFLIQWVSCCRTGWSLSPISESAKPLIYFHLFFCPDFVFCFF